MSDMTMKVVLSFILLYAVLMTATVFWIMPILESIFKLGGGWIILLLLVTTIIYTQVIMWIYHISSRNDILSRLNFRQKRNDFLRCVIMRITKKVEISVMGVIDKRTNREESFSVSLE